jgi:DNA-binding transcriptional ArsR family regulator
MMSEEENAFLREISNRGSWEDDELEDLRVLLGSPKGKKGISTKHLTTVLDWWSRPDEFGELYYEALQAYQVSFFAEEERRIHPYLKDAVGRAQELAEKLDFTSLIEELSQGLEIAGLADVPELVLAPSYWLSPLVMYKTVAPERTLLLFNGRPHNAALVPGEVVPDSIIRALKALADPTRLRVMRYLTKEPLTPSHLAKRLRLRSPTVIHHLNALRLAGLVHITITEDGDKRYTMRSDAILDTCESLKEFLTASEEV